MAAQIVLNRLSFTAGHKLEPSQVVFGGKLMIRQSVARPSASATDSWGQ